MNSNRHTLKRWLALALAVLVYASLPFVLFVSCDDDAHGGRSSHTGDDTDDSGGTVDDDSDDDDADDDDADDGENTRDIRQSDCIESDSASDEWTESLVLSWDGEEIAVEHNNTCRNCAFVLDVCASQGNRSINVSEFNDPEDDPADCDCLLDLDYVLVDMEPGSYTFILQADDFGGGAVTVFEEDVDLPEGEPASYEFTIDQSGACE